jgi:hypothetical protein
MRATWLAVEMPTDTARSRPCTRGSADRSTPGRLSLRVAAPFTDGLALVGVQTVTLRAPTRGHGYSKPDVVEGGPASGRSSARWTASNGSAPSSRGDP